MRSLLVLLVVTTTACSSSDEPAWTEIGECEPPAGSSDLPVAAVSVNDSRCTTDPVADGLRVLTTEAEWTAALGCDPAVVGIDFATQRVAVINVYCAPIDERFVVETPTEIVIGTYARISGACLGNTLVVPLPRSTKPVRQARCAETCGGDCPPVG